MLVYLLLTGMVMVLVYRSGNYPAGSDTMFHVYRGDVIYQSIRNGNWFPLLDPTWYNGAEILRYWAPFPAYIMAFCQFLGGGNLFTGYLWFTGLVLLFGAVSWLAIGISRKRVALGAFLGALWFFMPNNLFAHFWEGNLARSLCMIFLPLFVHYLHGYLYEEKRNSLIKMMLASFFMVLCHLGYAGMIFLTLVIYLLCYIALYKNYKRALQVVVAVACTFLWTGVWTIASLQGGITSTDSSQTMKGFFQSLWTSLNPVYRITHGQELFYFGLAAAVLAVFGIVLSKRKSMPGFITGIIVLLLTTSAAYPVISRLPGSQYLWMLRFISIALAFILFSFLVWDSLKKPIVVGMCLLLLLDAVPSLELVYGEKSAVPVEAQMEHLAERTLLKEAKEMTIQRLAFMDNSVTEARGAYVASSHGEKTKTTFGAGWQGANTAQNIVQLNQAAEQGFYTYLFDRCLELGNDTVLIDAAMLQNTYADLELVEQAAARVGYRLADKSSGYRVYHMDVDSEFGVITTYEAIAIGAATESFSMLFPAIEVGKSSNINDYRYEELSKYKLVFLDKFTYSDKKEAEDLLVRLSESGVRVVVSADGIPVNENNGVQEFLGVNGYSVQFANGYPIIVTPERTIDLDLFPGEHVNWKTVYLEGLDQCWAYIEDKGETLEFFGTEKNDNIVFVGLNLVYHCVLTKDRSGIELLSKAMEPITTEDVPERTLVPIRIDYSGNKIRIESEFDNVNTCIAYHDNFELENDWCVWEENNLAYVDAGVTEIKLYFPYFWPGFAVSMIGIVIAVILLRRNRWEEPKKS